MRNPRAENRAVGVHRSAALSRAILLRTGQAKESLRFLTEATVWIPPALRRLQLGAAIVTAGGDTDMAVRALQLALGPKGLGQWQDEVQRHGSRDFPTGVLTCESWRASSRSRVRCSAMT